MNVAVCEGESRMETSAEKGLTLELLISLTSSGPLIMPGNLLNFPVQFMTLRKWSCLLFLKKVEAISKVSISKELTFLKPLNTCLTSFKLVVLPLLLFMSLTLSPGSVLSCLLKVHCSCNSYIMKLHLYGSFPLDWKHIHLLPLKISFFDIASSSDHPFSSSSGELSMGIISIILFQFLMTLLYSSCQLPMNRDFFCQGHEWSPKHSSWFPVLTVPTLQPAFEKSITLTFLKPFLPSKWNIILY